MSHRPENWNNEPYQWRLVFIARKSLRSCQPLLDRIGIMQHYRSQNNATTATATATARGQFSRRFSYALFVVCYTHFSCHFHNKLESLGSDTQWPKNYFPMFIAVTVASDRSVPSRTARLKLVRSGKGRRALHVAAGVKNGHWTLQLVGRRKQKWWKLNRKRGD